MADKNTIISEIEENLLFVSANSTTGAQKPSFFDEDVFSLCTDRDNLVTGFALEKVLAHGVDRRLFISTDINFIDTSNNNANSSSSSRSTAATGMQPSISHTANTANDAVIDEQIDAFLSRLELIDCDEYYSVNDDDDLLPRERVRAIKLPKSAFEPLLAPLRSSRPPLYQSLIQHQLISGHIHGKRRSKKKDKDKSNKSSQQSRGSSAEKSKDKDSSSAEGSTMSKQSSKVGSRHNSRERLNNVTEDDNSNIAPLYSIKQQRGVKDTSDIPITHSQDTLKEILAVIVAKAVAEGTISAYLIAVSLLLRVLKQDNKITGTSPAISQTSAALSSSQAAVLALPIGNVIASLFETGENSSKNSGDGNDVTAPNPFKACLISSESRSNSPSCSDISRGDESSRTGNVESESGSVSISPSLRSQSASIGRSGYAGTVSDAGSTVGSTLADIGAGSISACDGDSEEAENQSEEYLLAQALALSIAPVSIENPARSNNGPVDVASSVGIGSCCETNSIPDSSSGSVAEYTDEIDPTDNPYSSYHNSNPIPDNLPNVPDLSTWGPFCNRDVWQTLLSYHAGDSVLSSISLRNVIFSLLVIVCTSADALNGSHKDDDSSSSNRNNSQDNFIGRKTACILKIDPHPLIFLLTEMLMDFLISELRSHASSQPNDDLNSNHPDVNNEWFLHGYFLLWCLNGVVKVAKAHLSRAIHAKVGPSSLGLGLIGAMSSAGGSNSDSLGSARAVGAAAFQLAKGTGKGGGGGSSYTPFVLRLLQRVADCMGLDSFVAGNHDNIVDEAIKIYSFARDSNEFKQRVFSHRHTLRMTAIDTFVCGLKYFRPSLDDRIILLENLFAATPSIENIDFKPQPFDTYSFDSSSSGDDLMVSDDDSVSKISLSSSYYKLYVLQQACKSLCSGGDVAINYLNSANSTPYERGSGANSPVLRASRPSQDSLVSSSALAPDIDPSDSNEDKLVDQQSNLGRSGDEINSDSIFHNIELILIHRLCSAKLMKECVVSDGVNLINTKELFWGEVQLLKAIQQIHINDFKSSTICAASLSPKLLFSSNKCNKDIVVSDGGKVAAYRTTKVWGTVAASASFAPNSGTHEWSVFVDKCDRGHVFVGVVTVDASVDTYIGGDRFGWGFIGTKSLWHNERKVKSEVGPGFNSQSVVNMRLDTDSKSLYFNVGTVDSGDTEWVLAFNNLPAVPLFPAISMHHRDDRIVLSSMASVHQSPSPSPTQSQTKKVKHADDLKRVVSMQRKFVSFTQNIISKINDILRIFSTECVSVDNEGNNGNDIMMAKILAHPFIGLFLPSLASAVIEMKTSAHVGYAVIQLLPQFILISKRLASAVDVLTKKIGSSDTNSKSALVGSNTIDVEGLWTFHCSGASVGSAAQQDFRLGLRLGVGYESEAVPTNSSSDEHNNAAGPVGVTGSGSSTSSSTSVVVSHGTLFGTRLKLSNTWKSTSVTSVIVDGRVSLCGCFFFGTLLDSKSNKSSTIEGVKIQHAPYKYSLNLYTRSVLAKASLVSTMACSKLAANLVIGLNPNPDDDVSADVDAGMDVVAITNDAKSSGDADASAAATGANTHPNPKDKAGTDLRKWVSSTLFSGGLPLDSALLTYLSDEVKLYSQRPIYIADLAATEDIDNNPKSKKYYRGSSSNDHKSNDFSTDLLNWWLAAAFPALEHYLLHSGGSSPSSYQYRRANADFQSFELPSSPFNSSKVTLTDITDDYNGILKEIASGKDNGRRIDEYILTHTGQSSLSKIGGEVMQVSRKLVLAAMVKHSGCARFCSAEGDMLRSGLRNSSDRPYQPLIDIWRAVQRVVEHTIRMKQSSGLSYGDVCRSLCSKAQLLLYAECNSHSASVGASLDLVSLSASHALRVDNEVGAPTNPNNPLDADRSQDFQALLSSVVEFFVSPFRAVPKLYSHLRHSAYRALCRTAGLKTFMMISGKCDTSFGGAGGASLDIGMMLPSLSSITLQSVSAEYVFLSLYGMTEVDPDRFSARQGADGVAGHQSGHYTSGLEGANTNLLVDVKKSFETVYEHITQLLSRCTWAGDRDAQSIALSAWGINIRSEHHLFLNRTGIFRVLQMVLDDARSCIASRAEKAQAKSAVATTTAVGKSSSAPDTTNISDSVVVTAAPQGGPYSAEFMLNTSKRLAQLVLRVVHALASQVAFSKDAPSLVGSSSLLQKVPSGPDTLSQSLFDMLFSELFSSMKNMIQTQVKSAKELSSLDQDEFLDGDQYIYRILRLLYFVSNSKICQCLLSSPKWFTLLLLGIGVGGLGVQRRILRLLRRLLINMDPDKFTAYIPSLFHSRIEVLEMESVLTDEDAASLIEHQRASLEDQSDTCAELLVGLFLEGISVILPATEAEALQPGSNTKLFLDHLCSQSTGESLSAESLLVLRVLQGVPSWRKVINIATKKVLSWDYATSVQQHSGSNVALATVSSLCFSDEKRLRMSSAALGVYGGYFDSLRLGGIAILKPFSLIGLADTLANRLAGISRSCGMLVSIADSNVEMVLMERGIRHLQSRGGSSIQHTTSMATTLPVATVKLSRSDIMASSDVPAIADFLSLDVLDEMLKIVDSHAMPWLLSCAVKKVANDRTGESSDPMDEDYGSGAGSEGSMPITDLQLIDSEISKAELDSSRVFTITSLFKALALSMQSRAVADRLLETPSVARSLIALSSEDSSSGGLCVLENIEEAWAKIWQFYTSANGNTKGGDPDSYLGADNNSSSAGSSSREGATPAESSNRPLRSMIEAAISGIEGVRTLEGRSLLEAAVGLFAPAEVRQVDAATQQAAINQMVDIGLPREWCDVALRRCRWNVEMAINMCFEHGPEMSQIVMEDAIMQASRQQESNSSGGGLERVLGRAAPRRSAPADSSALIRQLLEMGFPPSWCSRAMSATENNVDAALSWILSHGEELVTDDGAGAETTGTNDDDNEGITTSTGVVSGIVNPLSVLSGLCQIKDESTLMVSATSGGFPSVGCRGYAVSSGKWYYEATLHTAGCVQIGWADCSFEGQADNGQGVGDCNASWAYDGWRMYLWHETSADWGAKWSAGDILGCAVDMDACEISFFLNGFGVEIDMGKAFVDFACCGGLYPCASLSQKESIAFNFGSQAYAHTPPPGYRPFIEHVMDTRRRSSEISTLFNDKRLLKYILPSNGPSSENKPSNFEGNNIVLEDAVEECIGMGSTGRDPAESRRRYFSSDETRSSSTLPSLPQPIIPPIPRDRRELLELFRCLSKDLCILYARIAVLRLLSCLPSIDDDRKGLFLALLFPPTIAAPEAGCSDAELALDDKRHSSTAGAMSLIKSIRLAAHASTRTKIYLSVMALLPASVPIPSNLGSLFNVGGAPMLGEIRVAMASLLCLTRADGSNGLVNMLLDQILLDCLNGCRRDIAPLWSNGEGNFTPVIFRDSTMSSDEYLSQPSLHLAAFYTSLLIDQYAFEISEAPAASIERKWADTALMIETLIKHWIFALRSPSTAVRGCSIRILSTILQEFSQLGGRFITAPQHIVSRLCSYIPLKRLEDIALSRLLAERSNSPICSDYLQCLLDLVIACRQASSEDFSNLTKCHSPTSDSRDFDSNSFKEEEEITYLESALDDCNAEFSWEAVQGRLLSDNGWEILTGSLTQHRIPSLPSPDKKPIDRQENPPELLVGCKVVKTVNVVKETEIEVPWDFEEKTAATSSATEAEDGLEASLVEAIRAIRNERSIAADAAAVDAASADSTVASTGGGDTEGGDSPPPPPHIPKTKTVKKVETSRHEVIGTVTGISTWVDSSDSSVSNYHAGSARTVKWDVSGEAEVVRWGADGLYDVSQVKTTKNGKVTSKYPPPLSKMAKLVSSNFGNEMTFGVILRIRRLKSTGDPGPITCGGRLVGLLEIPDFNATVLISGESRSDGSIFIEERKLLTGPQHSSWGARFGHKYWRCGTTYTLRCSAYSDPNDKFDGSLTGTFEYLVDAKALTGRVHPYVVTGDIYLQKSQLFKFDEKMHPTNISVSVDGLAVTKQSGNGQSCVFGTVGFTSGVHFWEFKIDQADQGSVFLGVAEKPGPPGTLQSARCNRWMGSGYVNHRASLRAATQQTTDILKVYGDHFHTGDTVGVMLDLDRGRLNFFLDGLKYGEHIIADLGDAFTDLSNANSVRPKALFPVVGLSKTQDLVALSPRWMSSIGVSKYDDFNIVTKAWGLLSSWNFDRPTSMPSNANMWAYRYAWRDWCSWLSGRFVRVRSRCKSSVLLVAVDITPLACVDACIRLGLKTALFKGDRIVFERTCGRVLDTKEEAVILGAHKGQLWYRLDTSSSNSDSIMESTSLAWCLVAHDVCDFKLLRRGSAIEKLLPCPVIERPLPRSPSFQGGLISILHAGGAMMRNGIEIDTSDSLCTIPQHTVLYATEKRVNSSNIARYRVLFEDKFGWISERMRGSNEELMIAKVATATSAEVAEAIESVCRQATEHVIDVDITPVDVASVGAAVQAWCDGVREVHPELLVAGATLNPHSPVDGDNNKHTTTFEDYVSLATTLDGSKQWPVEADMHLAEVISKCASEEGVTPQNLPWQSLERHLLGLEGVSAATGSPPSALISAPIDRVIARAALLRVTNQAICYALPYLGLLLPEERLRKDACGHTGDVDIVPTTIPECKVTLPASNASLQIGGATPIIRSLSHVTSPQRFAVSRAIDANRSNESSSSSSSSSNSLQQQQSFSASPCTARRMRSLRRVLFSQTKASFWEHVLEASSTSTAMHQDEYEDPRELKVLKINRIKATPSRLSAISNPPERQRQSVFGQMHKEMRSWPNSAFRRSYVGKGHGGQKRAFKVKFVGEGVNDYGGPYRALFEQIIDELQNDSLGTTSKTLLPLLLPCPNRSASVGSNQDKFILTALQGSPTNQELMHFLGKLIGTAVRHNLTLGLNLSCLVWRPLVKLPLARAHLDTVDTLTSKHLEVVSRLGLELEQRAMQQSTSAEQTRIYTSDYRPDEWMELTFTLYLPDSTRHVLIPGGEDIGVTLGNWREYVDLVERHRLKESIVMFKALRDGISCVLPAEILPLFTSGELEQLVSGNSKVDIGSLRKITEYEDTDPSSAPVKYFWEILEEMSDEERTLFLRFVWARSRMPSSQESSLNFKIQGVQGEAKERPDLYLPYAQTCFFSLSLPPYSSKEIMRAKLLYAINNSPNMDADIKLHNAEGWAE